MNETTTTWQAVNGDPSQMCGKIHDYSAFTSGDEAKTNWWVVRLTEPTKKIITGETTGNDHQHSGMVYANAIMTALERAENESLRQYGHRFKQGTIFERWFWRIWGLVCMAVAAWALWGRG